MVGMTRAKKIEYKELSDATPIQAAVFADLILGATLTQLHHKYGIDQSTIQRWCRQFKVIQPPIPHGRNTPLPPENRVTLLPKADIPVGLVRNPSLDNLDASGQPKDIGVQMYEYLEASLVALKAQLRVASDESYIKRQNAHDLATLHNVIATKATDLINAFTIGQRGESGDEED